jgi:D-amino-acid dehydrogenase
MRAAIVGAGVVGLAIAIELRRRGADVVLVERDEPGAGASSGNAGWITPVFATPLPAPGVVGTSLRWMLAPDSPLFIRPRLDVGLVRWLWSFWRHANERDFERGTRAYASFAAHAMPDFDELARELVRPIVIEAKGSLFLFTTAAGAKHLRHEVDLMHEFGYGPAEILGPAQIRDLEPSITSQVAGGILVPQERYLRPETLVVALVATATDRGVDVRRSTRVTALRTSGRRVTALETTAGTIEADEVVIAAGAWSGALLGPLGLRVPIQAGRGYGITVESPATNLRRATYLAESRIACTPFDGALRLAGTMEFSGLHARPDPRRFGAIRRGADQYLSGWRGRAEALWSGARPVTPDGLPVIGRFASYANLSIASGHAMLGVTLAPSTALAIGDLLCGTDSRYELGAFAPDRFQ